MKEIDVNKIKFKDLHKYLGKTDKITLKDGVFSVKISCKPPPTRNFKVILEQDLKARE